MLVYNETNTFEDGPLMAFVERVVLYVHLRPVSGLYSWPFVRGDLN